MRETKIDEPNQDLTRAHASSDAWIPLSEPSSERLWGTTEEGHVSFRFWKTLNSRSTSSLIGYFQIRMMILNLGFHSVDYKVFQEQKTLLITILNHILLSVDNKVYQKEPKSVVCVLTAAILFPDVLLPHSCLRMNVPQKVNLHSMMNLIAAKCHQIPVTIFIMTWMTVLDPLLEVKKNIPFYLKIALMSQ
ncbi:uncharacterized protein KZ484_008069 [Pholidichthys leucotaenia]